MLLLRLCSGRRRLSGPFLKQNYFYFDSAVAAGACRDLFLGRIVFCNLRIQGRMQILEKTCLFGAFQALGPIWKDAPCRELSKDGLYVLRDALGVEL